MLNLALVLLGISSALAQEASIHLSASVHGSVHGSVQGSIHGSVRGSARRFGSASSSASAGCPPELLVKTQQGTVEGSFVQNNNVRQWYNVPFGADTSGANRFQPPATPLPWTGVRDATQKGLACSQRQDGLTNYIYSLLGVNGSYPIGEDCLNVNIWAPSAARAQGKKPAAVMVWLYGGAFIFGSNSLDVYRGDEWVAAQDDIIIVTINYRVGPFGFPQNPQLNGKATNLGLLDAKAAFDWIYANIAAFGGDPERIVGFGQSAGGIAMDALLFAYPDLKVKGAISQSGHASGVTNSAKQYPPLSTSINDPSTNWNRLSSFFNCGVAGDAAQLKCMQSVPIANLTRALSNDSYTFRPIPDNITFFNDYPARLSAGQFAKVPFMATANRQEGTINEVGNNGNKYWFDPFSAFDYLTPTLYCGAGQSAAGRTKNGVKAFQVRYWGDYLPVSPLRGEGAYHAAEVSMIFGTYRRLLFPQPATSPADQVAMSKYLQNVWSTFARDPQNGLDNSFSTYGIRADNATSSFVHDIGLENIADAVQNPLTVQSGRAPTMNGCKALNIPGF